MSKRGCTREIDHKAVVAYAAANPTMFQVDIAAHFGISQGQVSRILRAAGIQGYQRGKALKQKPGQTSEEFAWEKILQNCGLGIERGMRIHGKRIIYGFDSLKETVDNSSATSFRFSNPY